MKVSEALEMFLHEKLSEGIASATIFVYRTNIKYFIDFSGDIDIDLIDHKMIIDYRLHLLNHVKNENHEFKPTGGKLSKVSINTYLRSLRTMLNYLHEYGLIEKVRVKLLKEPKRVMTMLTDEEIVKLINLPEKTWMQQRNKLIIFMMLDSGLRRQEVINLKVDHVDLVNSLIRVKNSKGEKDRNVPLGKMVKKLFIKYMKNRKYDLENVFVTMYGGPINENSLKMMFQRMRESGNWEKLNSHFLRHNFATRFLINQYENVGMADTEQLRELLGHESITVTKSYLHLANQHLVKTHQFGVLANIQRIADKEK